MAKLKRTGNVADDIREVAESEIYEAIKVVPRFDYLVGTNSTLLDCAISGGRVHGGGIPGGILVEIYGPSGMGKTAVAVEIGSNAQARGGTVRFNDPEGRLDRDYATYYGLSLKDKDYLKSRTVEHVMEDVERWCDSKLDDKYVHVYVCDSLAALSTAQEMGDSGDKVGAARAKMFSQWLRRLAGKISDQNRLVVCTNQIRQNVQIGFMAGKGPTEITGGGEAIKFYASLRLRIGPESGGHKIVMQRTVRGHQVEKVIGIRSRIAVIKSSIDDPYREAPLVIMFRLGLDNVRANLEYCQDFYELKTEVVDGKETKEKTKKFWLGDKTYSMLQPAIKYVEDNNLEKELAEQTIALFKEVEAAFETPRKPRTSYEPVID